MQEVIGITLGMGFFLLFIGFFVVDICFPAQWHTKGVWFATSFLLVPVIFFGVAALAAYPPLIILLVIIALAGEGGRRKRK